MPSLSKRASRSDGAYAPERYDVDQIFRNNELTMITKPMPALRRREAFNSVVETSDGIGESLLFESDRRFNSADIFRTFPGDIMVAIPTQTVLTPAMAVVISPTVSALTILNPFTAEQQKQAARNVGTTAGFSPIAP